MKTVIDVFLALLGGMIVILTLFSAISTFVLPRSARSQLNRIVFGLLRRVIEIPLRLTRNYERRDAVMAYYAPIGLMLLVPTWYLLVTAGYAMLYFALGAGGWQEAVRLSGSSLITLGVSNSDIFVVDLLMYSEATLGLILVALLIAYLPTMYAAFSRREREVNLLEVRAGSPPSAVEMILRYHRIHGLDSLEPYWFEWEKWFAEVEESHTVLPALVFFRSPRPAQSWIVSAGTILDTAALSLAALDIPPTASAALCIRAGFLCLRRICDYFDIPYPADPHYPQEQVGITRPEFDAALERLSAEGVPVKADRDRAWQDFAGWRVNYEQTLMALCSLTLAPYAPWTSDRAPRPDLPPLFLPKQARHRASQ